MFCAALVGPAAAGCSARVNGFVSIGGDVGGSGAARSSMNGSSGGTTAPGSGKQTGGRSVAVGGTLATGAGGSSLTASGATSTSAGGSPTTGVITTSVGRVEATCPGKPLSEQDLANLHDSLSRNDAGCSGITREHEPMPTDLLLLVDTTPAMAAPVDGTSILRWDVVQQGIGDFVAAASAMSRVGLGFYGAYRESTNIPNCGIDGYISPAVSIDTPSTNETVIASHLAAMSSKLTFPATLYPALEGSLQYASTWQAAHLDHRTAVVLVTGSGAESCDKTIEDEYALVQRYSQGAAGERLRTFVIGVAGDQTNLDRLADGGGTSRAYRVDGANAPAQFQAALLDIVRTLMATFNCSIGFSPATPQAGDPILVTVTGFRSGTHQISRVDSAAGCSASDGGWYLSTNSNAEPEVRFCECSCPNEAESRLEVFWGCPLRL